MGQVLKLGKPTEINQAVGKGYLQYEVVVGRWWKMSHHEPLISIYQRKDDQCEEP
jgi:hypothetical protein